MGLFLGETDVIGGDRTIQTIESNTNILKLFPIRYYLYNSTTFVIPFDTGLTIRACGQGGAQSGSNGGGGGGYVKDYRLYKQGDIININFASGKVTITEANTGLNLVANPGSGTTGGTASGGNLINATGGAGGASAAGKASAQGCGGGGGGSGQGGGSGGFAGGNGYSAENSTANGGAGGTGGFFGGNGGRGYCSNTSGYPAGRGGDSTWGIGGNGGYGGSAGNGNGGTAGAGGNGKMAGGHGGNADNGSYYSSADSSTHTVYGRPGAGGSATGSTLYGRGGKNSGGAVVAADGNAAEGNPINFSLPKRTNHGGGNGGIAACILTIGEDVIPC